MLKLFLIIILSVELHRNKIAAISLQKNITVKARIVNGYRAFLGQFPWNAYLYMPIDKISARVCGGTIISDRYVLTSANCVSKAKIIKIGLGSVKKNIFQAVTYSNSTIIHPNYVDGEYEHDIAILMTSDKIKFSRYVKPATLPLRSMEVMDLTGAMAKVCGFGQIQGGSIKVSDSLKWIPVRILSQLECLKVFPLMRPSSICAKGINHAVCVGDSGGGLIKQERGVNYIIGIVSFGSAINCAFEPTGYQKITPNLDFIAHETNLLVTY